jgi:hypothetical protein
MFLYVYKARDKKQARSFQNTANKRRNREAILSRSNFGWYELVADRFIVSAGLIGNLSRVNGKTTGYLTSSQSLYVMSEDTSLHALDALRGAMNEIRLLRQQLRATTVHIRPNETQFQDCNH